MHEHEHRHHHQEPFRFRFEIEGEIMSQQTVDFTLVINPAVTPPNPLVVKDAAGNTLADGATVALTPQTVGVADTQKVFDVSGGTAPYSFAVASGAVPDGDSLQAATNADGSETVTLEGTPTTADPAAAFALTISDAAGATATLRAATRPKPAPRKIG